VEVPTLDSLFPRFDFFLFRPLSTAISLHSLPDRYLPLPRFLYQKVLSSTGRSFPVYRIDLFLSRVSSRGCTICFRRMPPWFHGDFTPSSFPSSVLAPPDRNLFQYLIHMHHDHRVYVIFPSSFFLPFRQNSLVSHTSPLSSPEFVASLCACALRSSSPFLQFPFL